MQTVDDKFKALGKRISLAIFYGQQYVYDESRNKWKVQVEFNDNGTQIKFEEIGSNLFEVLSEAYDRLDKTVTKGLGKAAMYPAIEAPKSQDEEIPF